MKTIQGMSKVRQQYLMSLRENEAFLFVSEPYKDNESVAYIRQHVVNVVASLKAIITGIEKLESDQTDFWSLLN